MEIYRNEPAVVPVRVPAGVSNFTVEVKSPYSNVSTSNSDFVHDLEKNLVLVELSVEDTIYDGTVSIYVTFLSPSNNELTVTENVQVVTPLFRQEDLDEGFSQDAREVERYVRGIIESFTGQKFGYFKESFSLSRASDTYSLPAPMLEFVGISSRYLTGSVVNPGTVPWEVVHGGMDFHVDFGKYYIKTDTYLITDRPHAMDVTVLAGYPTVPQPVKDAALVMSGMFNCDQSLWRERYLQNLRNADGSTVKYHDGAFVGTGSVTADQLLAPFVRRGFYADVI